jgi:hypothetical protein
MNSVIENGIVSWLLRREFLNPPVAHIGHVDEAGVVHGDEPARSLTEKPESKSNSPGALPGLPHRVTYAEAH